MATDPTAWTKEDELIAEEHCERLRAATKEGTVVLAGRSLDGVGPAIVVLEAESDEEAKDFMDDDPFIISGLFTASLHPFRVALGGGTDPD